ncbi:hypothetical protein ACMDB5_08385 [Flavobacterium sp. W1B]|uniref:hypothetical protein n=1 Tax=Flavobacterium sp. W1B TaxID=3394146 RepID=UPI0039BD6B61
MSSEVQNANNHNSVSILNDTLEQFKAIFYLAKGKRDTQIKLYTGNKVFCRQNVIDLNDKIEKKLLNYSVSNKLTSISINLSGNNIKSYGNWNEFLCETWETSEKTETITINWDFEMILPNRVHTLPQTHSLKVRLGNELKPNEIFHMMIVGGDEFELEESQAQMVAKVDFVNDRIATELLAIVNDWYNLLPENVAKKDINEFLEKHGVKLRMVMEILIILSGLLLFYPIATFFIINSESSPMTTTKYLKYSFFIINGVFLSYTIFTRVSAFYAQKFNITMSKLRDKPIFMFTVGDKNEQEKIESKNKGLRREIYMKLLISFISSGILFALGFTVKMIIEYI